MGKLQHHSQVYRCITGDFWMRPTGEYFTYDKKHLFGAEEEIYKEGGQIVTVQEQGWNFRLNIC